MISLTVHNTSSTCHIVLLKVWSLTVHSMCSEWGGIRHLTPPMKIKTKTFSHQTAVPVYVVAHKNRKHALKLMMNISREEVCVWFLLHG